MKEIKDIFFEEKIREFKGFRYTRVYDMRDTCQKQLVQNFMAFNEAFYRVSSICDTATHHPNSGLQFWEGQFLT